MQIYNTKDPATGEFIIPSIRIGQICAECQRLQRICTHEENTTAAGTSARKTAKFQFLYGNKQQLFMQEMFGEAGNNDRTLFESSWTANLLEKPLKKIHQLVDLIMVSIDPAQGGACEWGMTACIYDIFDRTQNIVHLDAHRIVPASPANIKAWLARVFESIQSRYPGKPIVVACEAAPLIAAENIASYINELIQEGRVYNIHMLYQDNGSPGVPKTNENTQLMVTMTRELLQNNRVNFAKDFRTTSITHTNVTIQQELGKQLGQFTVRAKVSNEFDRQMKICINGKGGGNQDDLGVSYIMNYYWYVKVMSSFHPRYEVFKNMSRSWRKNDYVRIYAPSDLELETTSVVNDGSKSSGSQPSGYKSLAALMETVTRDPKKISVAF